MGCDGAGDTSGLLEGTAAVSEDGLLLAYLERFIDFGYDTGTEPRPMYVTANGVREEMPRRLRADALALRAALAERQPAPLDVPADTGPNGEPVYRQPLQPDCGDCAVLEDGPRERHIERDHPVALDAAQPAPLDVERLAVALHRWRAIFVDPADPEAWYMKSAAAIAREYAALASEDAP